MRVSLLLCVYLVLQRHIFPRDCAFLDALMKTPGAIMHAKVPRTRASQTRVDVLLPETRRAIPCSRTLDRI